jgi:DhnA family fructose-bisphosphate aldolase class Ia
MIYSSSFLGKTRRMNRLFTNGRTVIVPVDDSLIFGPFGGLQDINTTISKIINSKPNALLGFKGAYSAIITSDIPFILNVTASTVLSEHTKKMQITDIQTATAMGVDCVAAHINFGSVYEPEMMRNLSLIIDESDRAGLPVLTIVYPRSEKEGKDYNYEDLKEEDEDKFADLVCHCVRVAAEMGADIIKTQYTGSIKSFERVIRCAMDKPVVIAGGPVVPIEDSLRNVEDSILAGAAGISFGRNVFNAENIEDYLRATKDILFRGMSASEALNSLGRT